jgi:hypothetical protein
MKLKNIKKQNTMKTRIFTMTGIILFTVISIADAANHRVKNRLDASCQENVISNSLESWVMARDNWEQGGQAETFAGGFVSSSMLNEWIAARDNWEQEGEEMISATTPEKKISLEAWIAGRDSWEQEGQEINSNFARAESAGMEDWIAGITEWEQK